MMEWRGRRRQQQEEERGWWGPTNRHSGKKYGRQPPSPAGNLSSKGSLVGFCRVCSLISFPFYFLRVLNLSGSIFFFLLCWPIDQLYWSRLSW